jgi:hypothetical protein
MEHEMPEPPPPHRRAFLAKSCAVLIGSIAGAFPVATGVAVFLDPPSPQIQWSDGFRFCGITQRTA